MNASQCIYRANTCFARCEQNSANRDFWYARGMVWLDIARVKAQLDNQTPVQVNVLAKAA